jgi:hypothetical protein
MVFDDRTIEVTCSNGHRFQVKMGKARKSPVVGCPQCDATVEIDGKDLDRKMRRIDHEIDRLKRAFRRR